MRFTFDGVEYGLTFQYFTKKNGKKVRNYTTARIENVERRGNAIVVRVIAEGTVVRYFADKFVKETARQYALEAMLEQIQGMDPQFVAFRRAILAAYFNRFTKPVAEVTPQEVAKALTAAANAPMTIRYQS